MDKNILFVSLLVMTRTTLTSSEHREFLRGRTCSIRAYCGDQKVTTSSGEILGPPGPEGEKGERGKKGDAGLRGPKGKLGRPGDPGQPGAPKGEDGDIGPPGDTGPAGQRGADGCSGMPGETGSKGFKGLPGMPGLDCPDNCLVSTTIPAVTRFTACQEAFHAVMVADRAFNGRRLKLEKVLYNTATKFYNNLARFVAQEPGTYTFQVTVTAMPGKRASVTVTSGFTTVSRIDAEEVDDSKSLARITQGFVSYLNTGDDVSLLWVDGADYIKGDGQTSFTGACLWSSLSP